MSWTDLAAQPGVAWLIAAVVLGIAELAVPGVFLVLLAIAAAITGGIALAIPDLSLTAALVSFAIWSVVIVLIGRRWYRDYPLATADPLLNDRAARMIGQTVRVSDAIIDGHGRVRVGDGEWPATRPDAVAGAKVTVMVVEDGVVRVAPFAASVTTTPRPGS